MCLWFSENYNEMGQARPSQAFTGKLLKFFPAEGDCLAPYLLVHLEFHSCHLSFYAVDKDPWLRGGGILFWPCCDLPFTKCLCCEWRVNLFFFSCSMWDDKNACPGYMKALLDIEIAVFKPPFPRFIARLVTVSHQWLWDNNKRICTMSNKNLSVFFSSFSTCY